MTKEKESAKAPKPQLPKLTTPPNLDTEYVNVVRIAHTPSELVLDFARLFPGSLNVPVLRRILMSPLSAKLFHRALTENLAKYETTYGEIVIPQKQSLADHLFGSLQPPEQPPEAPPEE